MNPITNMKNLNKMNQFEIDLGVAGTEKSWHNEYKDSAWIFAGGLPYELTEGDVICVFSQYGEIVHINLIRDQKTGKSKGFGFICYEDQRSTILAVDNLNGMKLCGRLVRVDHVHTYRLPKDLEKMDADRKKLFLEGCAPKPIEPTQLANDSPEEEVLEYKSEKKKKKKKEKKKKSKKKKKKHKRVESSSESETESEDSESTDDSEIEQKRKSRRSPDREKKDDRRRQRSNSPEPYERRRRSVSRDRSKRGRSKERYRKRSNSREMDKRSRSRSRDNTRHRNRSQDRSNDDYRRRKDKYR